MSFPARRRFLAVSASTYAAVLLGALPPAGRAWAASPAAPAASPFKPILGQHGKDVMWLPTPQALIDRLLKMAGVGPDDLVVDLGSGDGKIVITAARDFGARARGIEYDSRMVELSRYNAGLAKVTDRTEFVQGDIFASDFSDATVVAMYLLPHLNLRLRAKLMAMRPGTRIITHQFHLGTWEPDETTLVSNRPGYLWIVPARVAGQWRLDLPWGGPVQMELAQTFQKLAGTVTLPGVQTTLRTPRLAGDRIAFAYTGVDGRLLEFDGRVDGDTLQGTVASGDTRGAFSATRVTTAQVVGTAPADEQEIAAAVAELGAE